MNNNTVTLYPKIAIVSVDTAIPVSKHNYYSGITIDRFVQDPYEPARDTIRIILCNGLPSQNPPIPTDWCETVEISMAQAKELTDHLLAALSAKSLQSA